MQPLNGRESENLYQAIRYHASVLTTLATAESNGRHTILIVDDDQPIRELTWLYLKSLGYNVLLAENEAEALEYVMAYTLDLIILDIGLPKLDGIAICATIRQYTETPIVLLTAVNQIDDAARAFQVGADGYITRPFTLDTLKLRIQAFLNGPSRLSLEHSLTYSSQL